MKIATSEPLRLEDRLAGIGERRLGCGRHSTQHGQSDLGFGFGT
jgi:hypothetical protein